MAQTRTRAIRTITFFVVWLAVILSPDLSTSFPSTAFEPAVPTS